MIDIKIIFGLLLAIGGIITYNYIKQKLQNTIDNITTISHAAILIALLFIGVAIYFDGEHKEQQDVLISNQQQQISVLENAVKTRDEIRKSKQINQAVSASDDLNFLRKNSCQDC
jgi:hypothetical protein